MKIFFSVIAAFIMFSAHSQPEQFIMVDNGVWSTLEVHCLPNGNNYSTYHIKFEGDTVIEGLNYKIIWRSNDAYQSNWFYYGSIRENEQNQVFTRPPFYIEGMIYDFGASIGDTVHTVNQYLGGMPMSFVVSQTDSVLMLDRYRKRMVVYETDLEVEEVWIEGLGCLYGILHSGNWGYGSSCGITELLCYEESDLLVYQHSDYDVCHYYSIVGTRAHYDSEISIFPNPATTKFMIDLGSTTIPDHIHSVQIYTSSGKRVYSADFSGTQKEIDLQKFNRGMYLVRLISSQEDLPAYKLIVE